MQLRPIERYWAIVKRKLNRNAGAAKDLTSMRNKWNQHATAVSAESMQALMGSIKRNVRAFARSGDF